MAYQYAVYIATILSVWAVAAYIIWIVNRDNLDGFNNDEDDDYWADDNEAGRGHGDQPKK